MSRQIGEVVLDLKKVSLSFGGVKALTDISFDVREHEIRAIIGPNGAGKTTLFNCVSSTLRPTAGHVLYRGRDITGLPLHRIAHLGIGRAFQITNIFPGLTALENVRLAAQALGGDNLKVWMPAASLRRYVDQALKALDAVGLAARAGLPAAALSHGDKRKLELAIALAARPKLLLLDEPAAGMATEQVPELMQTIAAIRKSGDKTILLVEHNMSVVMSISDRITVMHQGRILAEGSPAEIKANEAAQSAYLGTG